MRKAFGLKPMPNKLQASPTTEKTRIDPDMSPTSFAPISSFIGRPALSPQIIAELRQSCAKIVQESGPSGAEYEEILNQPDPLEKYQSERAAYREMSGHRTQPVAKRDSKIEASFSRQQSNASNNTKYVHKPTYAARDFQATSVNPNTLLANNLGFEPLEPTHTTTSGHGGSRKPIADPNDPLTQIRSALEYRPKTSAAACIDYAGPTMSADNSSSSSTSRTATTYDPVRPSTGLTSLAITPANEKRASAQLRISEQILQDGPAASQADATAKAWMAHELARRREEASSTLPVLQKSTSRASLHRGHSGHESDRPSSRAGSIAEGIREYIRPRASMESFRSARTSDLSRPASRSSNSNKGSGWWRGASANLRRKGSWSSFRSAKPDDGLDSPHDRSATTGAGKEKPLDLNRSLPPLPGLDSYKEEKKKKLHISQLMSRARDTKPPPPTARTPLSPDAHRAPGADYFQLVKQRSRPATAAKRQSAIIVDGTGFERMLSDAEERSRENDLRRAVQEKMFMGAISPPVSPRVAVLRRVGSQGSQSMSPGPSLGRPSASREGVEGGMGMGGGGVGQGWGVAEGKKRWGFRWRMSRFLGGKRGPRPVTAH